MSVRKKQQRPHFNIIIDVCTLKVLRIYWSSTTCLFHRSQFFYVTDISKITYAKIYIISNNIDNSEWVSWWIYEKNKICKCILLFTLKFFSPLLLLKIFKLEIWYIRKTFANCCVCLRNLASCTLRENINCSENRAHRTVFNRRKLKREIHISQHGAPWFIRAAEQNIVRIMKYWRLRCALHISRMWE